MVAGRVWRAVRSLHDRVEVSRRATIPRHRQQMRGVLHIRLDVEYRLLCLAENNKRFGVMN